MSSPETCDLLRSLHRRGDPLLLPNVWDAATARVVVEAGFPVVATGSVGVAAALGYADHEAPIEEMFAAAARIASVVDVPVTVDAEAGYGMEPAALVAALREAGAAGCNLEDSDAAHVVGELEPQVEYLRAVREAATEAGYPLVINARVDVFFGPVLAGAGPDAQADLLPDALRRAHAYLEAGADCVYPVSLWAADVLRGFVAEVDAPVNVVNLPQSPSLPELAELGVARVSWGPLLHWAAMARFKDDLAALRS